MRLKLIGVVAVVAVALTAAVSTASGAVLREFEGRVVSVNKAERTFRLHDSERGTKTIKVNRNTRFERVNGLRGLSAGDRFIEATVRRVNGRWIANEVERSGGGGQHGGRDDDRDDDDSSGRGRGGDDD